MDREGTSPPIYANKNHFDAMWDYIDAKMDAQIELIKHAQQMQVVHIFNIIFTTTLKCACF
jgi:hypothetical protein